jgi:hypothetical protein
LDAAEAGVDRLGERPDHEGLGEAGQTLEQDVATREQRDQKPFDRVVLPDDPLVNGVRQAAQ